MIVGCGIIGATIAYELSRIESLQVTVLDRQSPAHESTGAALGVLMGVVSHKTKGRAWSLRETSLRRYAELIPELEAQTGDRIPANRDGIVMLLGEHDDPGKWQRLRALRQTQGWDLHLWTRSELGDRCPYIGDSLDDQAITGAVYSPHDRQIHPVALTHALVKAAQQNGVTFHFNAEVQPLDAASAPHATQTYPTLRYLTSCHHEHELIADWVIMAAGLGAAPLSQHANHPIDIRPVLGQAIHLQVEHPMGLSQFHPVISGHDVHIVPLGDRDYWVGATVEFPDEGNVITADDTQLETVLAGAIAMCPPLKTANRVYQWSGLRPRPWNRSAPIIEPLPDYPHVILATGHYRNGVLLAPATAQHVYALIAANA